jgi:hypothetical protein
MGTEFFWFYELFAAALFIAVVFVGVKRGFVSLLVGFLSLALGVLAAWWACEPISGLIYDNFVAQQVNDAVEEYLPSDGTLQLLGDLSSIDTNLIKVSGLPLAEADIKPDSAGKITLDISKIDLSKTGVDKLDLSAYGVDLSAMDLTSPGVGMINITAAELMNGDLGRLITMKTLIMANAQVASPFGNVQSVFEKVLPDELVDASGAKLMEILGTLGLDGFAGDGSDGSDNSDASDASIAGTHTVSLESVVEQGVIQPAIMSLIKPIVFVLVFTVAVFILRLVSKLFRALNYLPVIGGVNAVFGGLLGFVQAFVIIMMVCAALRIVIGLTGNDIVFINTTVVDKTVLFKALYDINPLNLFL